jgi:hypothetical protein
MDWSQVATIFGSNIALFLWATRQARTDFLHLDRKLEENRKETNAIVQAIREDIRDFHDRLCAIEESRKK